MPPEEAKAQPAIIVPLEFYRGVDEIARFLGIHERTVRKRIAAGKLPGGRDEAGTYVMTNLDYYLSIER